MTFWPAERQICWYSKNFKKSLFEFRVESRLETRKVAEIGPILHFSSTKKTHRRRPRIKKRLKQAGGLVDRVLIMGNPNLRSDFKNSKAFSRYDRIPFNERVSRKLVGIFEIGLQIRIFREKNSPSLPSG